MSEFLLDEQSPPVSPSAGTSFLFPHNYATLKQWAVKNSDGTVFMIPGLNNGNTADAVASAADTYLTGSSIVIPGHLMQVKTRFRWRFAMTKSAAGTAAPIWRVRIGINGTTADAAILTFTQVALQTAVVDTGIVQIDAILRNIGVAGVLAGSLQMQHVLAATGFSTLTTNILQVTSAGFDTTVANLIAGVSVNPGASGVWTHQLVTAEALNL